MMVIPASLQVPVMLSVSPALAAATADSTELPLSQSTRVPGYTGDSGVRGLGCGAGAGAARPGAAGAAALGAGVVVVGVFCVAAVKRMRTCLLFAPRSRRGVATTARSFTVPVALGSVSDLLKVPFVVFFLFFVFAVPTLTHRALLLELLLLLFFLPAAGLLAFFLRR